MESMGVIVGLLFYGIVISHYRKNGKKILIYLIQKQIEAATDIKQ